MGMAIDFSTKKFAATSDVAGQLMQLNAAASTSYTIADASATSLFTVQNVAGQMSGGVAFYQVQASDGTDYQSMVGMITYAVVSKAGTQTLVVTDVTANNAKAASSGTLTLTWTFVTGTNLATIKLQPTGSLTETTYNVTLTVLPITGIVTFV